MKERSCSPRRVEKSLMLGGACVLLGFKAYVGFVPFAD